MTRLLLFVPALLLSACASDPTDNTDAEDAIGADAEAEAAASEPLDIDGVRLGAEVEGEMVDVVTTEDGKIEFGVTDAVLFARLSAPLRAEIETEMAEDTAEETGLGGTIARAVTGAVAEGLGTAMSVPLSDIRDVRYESDRVVIEMVDGEASPFANAKTDGEPVLSRFAPDAGRRLADAFDKATAR